MHYYKRNLGDYAKKAGRLSMLEHGSYTLLIDACYDRERFPTICSACGGRCEFRKAVGIARKDSLTPDSILEKRLEVLKELLLRVRRGEPSAAA